MRFKRNVLGLVLALCIQGGMLWAQETRAIISGTVTDPTGAAVPAAKLDIRNLETNVVTTTQTNGSGIYTAPPINPVAPVTNTRMSAPRYNCFCAKT